MSRLVCTQHDEPSDDCLSCALAGMSDGPGWYVVDVDDDENQVRGPFATMAEANAVRGELQRSHPYYSESGTLHVTEDA